MTDTMQSGEACVRIDGASRPLKLTLGALAELEEAFDAANLEALAARLSNPSAGDLLRILRALLAGGGVQLTLDALRASDLDLSEAAEAVRLAFAALSAGAEAPGKPHAPGSPGSASPSA